MSLHPEDSSLAGAKLFDKRWTDVGNPEHAANKYELEKRIRGLKSDLQSWKNRLEEQVATYKSVRSLMLLRCYTTNDTQHPHIITYRASPSSFCVLSLRIPGSK
jgi:hypothetical protein